ncbi:MAG: DedA family protein [Ignavibacteriota bacterium]|nr:DedA family protein [Ignavibacteriota bacterium]MCO6448650.1 DedA family protein [Ignavibacterium album]MCZ2268936.1 DedA family protein [Ignavibacteriales bacterium]HMN18361.1 DedA family protein [Ignavibacteriaceae bacterium]MEB2354334.1 DedA family protein [Ignavibacteriales bacterium]
MIEELLAHLSGLTPIVIYVLLFTFAYIENLFPPSPSDIVIVIGGTLIGTNYLHFVPTLIFATGGSIAGFLTAFGIGWLLDKKLIHSGKLKFINIQTIEKAEAAFRKWGYYLIIANRFLPGTRAVISFFGGMSRLDIHKTMFLSSISSLLWNIVLIYLGILFGKNVALVDKYLNTYSNIVITLTAIVILLLVINYFIKRKKSN